MLTQAYLSRVYALGKCLLPTTSTATSSHFRVKSSLPHMPECEFTPAPYKGLSKDEILTIRSKHLPPTHKTTFTKPLLQSQGWMQYVWDEQGKRYLDLFGGIATVSVGHCHPKVTEAIQKQLGLLWHTTQLYLHSPIHEYAEKLANEMPGDLKVCFFTNSGSEANDLAMLLARIYTKAFDIISFRNAYHGGSPYTLGLTAHGSYKHSVANGFGIHHSMNPDPYKGVWGGKNCRDSLVQPDRQCDCAEGECKAGGKYLEQLEEVLEHSIGQKPAGLFAEPLQGVGGVVQFPKGFLKNAYEMIRSRGGVCVADEVQSGFGRMGSHMWGFQTHGVIPDIVTMAKGIGNGLPMGAVVTTPEIANAVASVNQLNTFGGNPLSTAAASAVLDVIKDDGILENCQNVGDFFILELAKLRDETEIVGDVRGKGLMLGVEMVESKESKKPLNKESMIKMRDTMKDLGVLIGVGGVHGNILRIKPPMCLSKKDVEFAMAVIRRAIEECQ